MSYRATSAQSVQAGKELPNPIVLRVLSEDGRPVEAAQVGLVVATGGGSVNPGSAVTDANGEARGRWVFGPAAPEQTLKALVAGIEPATITATAIVPGTCASRSPCRDATFSQTGLSEQAHGSAEEGAGYERGG